MVKIAIAGGSGEVASEVIAALVATKKHDITIFSRNKASAASSWAGVTRRSVDYGDKHELAKSLDGIHTVLSFVQLLKDPGEQSQRNLIDACILAGVKRFAPSEWASATIANMPWWTGKHAVREYLKQINVEKQVLEYTLFQPGLFLDYLAFPHKTSTYITPLNITIDFENRRAIVVEGHDAIITFTTVSDLAAVVARAVEYEGEWPVNGGISGNSIPVSQILEIGAKIRGRPFTIDTVKLEDLEQGNLKTSWSLETSHPSIEKEQAAEMMKGVLIGMLLSSAKGAWHVSDDFNGLFPDYQFTEIEQYLRKVWDGKP